jgi:hypothetical protein
VASEGDQLRAELGQLVRQLVKESYVEGEPISQVIQEHLGGDVAELAVHKELLRKAALTAVVADRRAVTAADVDSALGELLDDTAALTRVLLGSGPSGDPAAPSPHAWMERGGQTSVQTIRSAH